MDNIIGVLRVISRYRNVALQLFARLDELIEHTVEASLANVAASGSE
jgi:hypothetical protein